MTEKNKVTVYIAGNEYVLSGDESSEHIQRVALFVDRKLKEISKKNHTLSTSMASVLASVNMADEMLRTKEHLNNKECEFDELKKRHQDLFEEHQHLKAQYAKIEQIKSQLQIELTKREAEVKEMRNTINTISNTKR